MSAPRAAGEAVDNPRRPTLTQVAELAGVSLKTASRALNDEPNVAEATGARVRQAADLLGYRLNGIARELRRGATSALVGLVSGDLANPFYSAVASGIERELRQHGLQLVTANTDEDAELERALVEAFLERRVRALLVVPSGDRHEYLAIEGNRGVPFVFLDRPPDGLEADAVLIDNAGGARAAGEHLLSHGHRRIALVADLARMAPQRGRLDGFVQAMDAAGNDQWRPYLRTDVHDVHRAEETVRELLTRDPPPTALFTTNNRLTTGALRALRGHPAAPALIGFDDFDLADVIGTTVVAHDPVAMGREAARLAHRRISGFGGPAQTVIIPTEVVARGSGERAPA
ncbi:LacI family DNA-binding transcriptional regulator [Couchioplanes caeruleus]|uniref:LacI family transcriptional regulator n=2 Tax=Couchioplanes caeruleus TaxID=56438 RepID=A0A1K0GPL8_9ACTN|nr:LacI family DNA-binding transcriptional regulator [Couchioplanes caeruleus]OJF14326.1 LacI family transcriptional regulator [Couchioplanes caeruleus subsp. caeruleus]ROP32872.1 LacI family transcriptional regulator [Couchioplanes caeruleus]